MELPAQHFAITINNLPNTFVYTECGGRLPFLKCLAMLPSFFDRLENVVSLSFASFVPLFI